VSAVTITIAVDAPAGIVRVHVAADPAACDCGTTTGEHEPDCGAVVRFEALRQERWPWWWHRHRRRRRRR
jgi:hypothetical protein